MNKNTSTNNRNRRNRRPAGKPAASPTDVVAVVAAKTNPNFFGPGAEKFDKALTGQLSRIEPALRHGQRLLADIDGDDAYARHIEEQGATETVTVFREQLAWLQEQQARAAGGGAFNVRQFRWLADTLDSVFTSIDNAAGRQSRPQRRPRRDQV